MKQTAIAYCPLVPTPRQKWFIESDNQIEYWVEGRGAGKTTGMLMSALRDIDVPGYRALILTPDSVQYPWDTLRHWIPSEEVSWKQDSGNIVFPSGGILQIVRADTKPDWWHRFGAAEFQFIGIDDDHDIRKAPHKAYLMSRFRNGEATLRFRITRWIEGIG